MNNHTVFCPKRRRKILIGRLKERLESIIDQVTDERWGVMMLEVVPGYVHLFISVDPNVTPRSVVKVFKGTNSRLLRKEFPDLMKMPSLRTHSYLISTIGRVSMATIQKHKENQMRK